MFFLAADEEAVPLYKMCGFKEHHEQKYVVNLERLGSDNALVDLRLNEPEKGFVKPVQMSPQQLLTLKKGSAPLSTILSASDDEHILMFYYLMNLWIV